MFHLDYLSCFLTIIATILLARKSWIGLLVAIVNSLIVCAIGLRTSQLGFIPANLFCVGVYAFSMRSWLKERTNANRSQVQRRKSLSGRLSLEDIAELETQIKSEASGRQPVLDLRHVTLVGQDAIAFSRNVKQTISH